MKEQFKDKLLYALKKKGMTQSDLSNATGITASSISDWINGRYIPKQDKIYILANALDVKPSFLLGYYDDGDDDGKTARHNVGGMLKVLQYKVIPILGNICAGDGIWCEENYSGHIVVDTRLRTDFALMVKGDSMINAHIKDGDIALFQKTPTVENGQIAAVRLLEDNTVTLKKVYYKENFALLQPANDNYEPIITNEFEVLGWFVGIYYKEMV